MAKLSPSRRIAALAFAVGFLLPAATVAGEHSGSAKFGVPIPLSIHGVKTDFDWPRSFLGTALAEYDYRFLRDPALSLGVWGELSALYEGNDLGTNIALLSGGPQIVWRAELWPDHGIGVATAAGLGALLSHLTIDENISKTTIALGARLSLQLERRISPNWAAGFGVALEAYGAPLREAVWFNRRLGGTSLLIVGFAVRWTSVDS